MAIALTDAVVLTETAVNNSEVKLTLNANLTRLTVSSPVNFELRVATGGDGIYCAKEDHLVIENAGSWRGQEIWLWSAGNNDIHTMQELGVIN